MAFDLETFLEDPITTKLFDRTEDQRARLVSVQNEVRKEGVPESRVQIETNRRLFKVFGQEVTDIAQNRANEVVKRLPDPVQSLPINIFRMQQAASVKKELDQLNSAMMVPGLKRLENNSAEVK